MQALTGIDQSDYSKIENGKRYFTFEQYKRIAMVLNTSMDYLAGMTKKNMALINSMFGKVLGYLKPVDLFELNIKKCCA